MEKIGNTKDWLENIVIKHNFCPFAKKELLKDSIRFHLIESNSMETILEELVDEFTFLDKHPNVETTLLVLNESFDDFDDYLDLVEISNALLEDQGHLGVYQIASFHPDYCFEDTDVDDPANYTNRSPYPTLHILREASLENAIESHPDPEGIPERNIAYARTLGLDALKNGSLRTNNNQ